ncbi:MAG: DNA polymerase III subunit delta' [Anaerolineae bacterium]|nr:DNA polymerase III subunit delta' [Anaerolineae bacterium]
MKPSIAEWSVIGHDHAVSMLQRALSGGELSHAYLITGPSGVGKTTLALEFAAALFCESEERRPCGACSGCRRVAAGSHPDLHLVESASSGTSLKIEQIRALQHSLALTPAEGSWRVAILQRLEEATAAATNALLKSLEEPPSYVVMLVLARDAESLLPTIVSRCQHIPLRPQPVAVIQHALMSRWGATLEKASLLAHLADGRLGWAVRTLQDPAALGRRDRCLDDLDRLLAAPTTHRFQYAAELAKDACAAQEILGYWLTWWRDVMLCSAGDDSLLVNIDRRADLYSYARTFGVRGSAAAVEAVRDVSERIQRNASLRLALEVLMLDIPTR